MCKLNFERKKVSTQPSVNECDLTAEVFVLREWVVVLLSTCVSSAHLVASFAEVIMWFALVDELESCPFNSSSCVRRCSIGRRNLLSVFQLKKS